MIIDIKMSMLNVTVYCQSCYIIARDTYKPYLHFSPFTLILYMDNYLVSSTQIESYVSGFLGIYFYL